MAVSLAQYSRELQARPRASTGPPRIMTPYDPSQMVPMPMPEQFQTHYATRAPQYYSQSYTSAPLQWRPQQSQTSQNSQQSPFKLEAPFFFASPEEYEASEDYRPPVPPKRPAAVELPNTPPSPQGSNKSSSSAATAPSWRTSIEPDPLPPHSNPQALTQSQSEAFTGSQPIPPVHIGKDEVRSFSSGLVDYRITRQTGRGPAFLSSKPLLTVTKVSTAKTVGTIRFHTLTSNRIDVTINGHETSISHHGLVHSRWGFEPTSTPNTVERWYWKKDRSTGGAMLGDHKWNGNVLARMKGDLLTFEKPRLSSESYDEIVVTAIAMAEAARRQKSKGDIVDIASAIGEFTSSDGGGGSDGRGGGD